MSNFDTHFGKYQMFKADANNQSNSIPTRIETYFYAAFHLIEAISAKAGIHIEKHQKVRTMLENNPQIFGENTEQAWRALMKLKIR